MNGQPSGALACVAIGAITSTAISSADLPSICIDQILLFIAAAAGYFFFMKKTNSLCSVSDDRSSLPVCREKA